MHGFAQARDTAALVFCFGLVFKTNCHELGFEFVARRSGCPVMASGNWLQRGQGRAKLCLISFKNRC